MVDPIKVDVEKIQREKAILSLLQRGVLTDCSSFSRNFLRFFYGPQNELPGFINSGLNGDI